MTEPYYSDDYVTLYHGDCREITEWLEADVLVTDPPYGMAYESNRTDSGPSPIAGDKTPALRDECLAAWGDRPALVFGTWRVQRPASTRHLIFWDKGNDPGTGDLSMPWGHSCEEVYVIGRGWIGKRGPNVLHVDGYRPSSGDRPDHPTPKPPALMEQLLAKCPSGVVADPFVGSGPTLIAAKRLGRHAIGVELDERYCEIAAKRVAQHALDFGAVS